MRIEDGDVRPDVLLLPRLVAESRRVLPLHQQTMGPPPDEKEKKKDEEEGGERRRRRRRRKKDGPRRRKANANGRVPGAYIESFMGGARRCRVE